MNFNEESTKPQFMYKRNPLVAHAYQIFEYKDEKGEYEPVGEYTLLDAAESAELTEKKVMNLISIMNGRKRLIDVKNLTSSRILFNIVPKQSEDEPTTIIFREYNGDGPSKENAMLVIEKGVFDEEQTLPQ